jgi:methylthioribose-1-phosphate isomerase
LVATRPTAVNLAWGVERVVRAWSGAGASAGAGERGAAGALAEAERLADEDVACNRALGAAGSALLGDGARVLTHCNAGALACVGYGTALGVVRAAAEAGKRPRVWVDETRPVLQGARLTAWELDRLGIEATLVADVAAASLMARGEVDCVIVGADRVAANGDVANKVGTYALAVLAKHHDVPFYVAAPTSTIDMGTPDGGAIVVEERAESEVTSLAGVPIAPHGVRAHNPAFDITPAGLVTALITEHGVTTRSVRESEV